MALPPTNPKQAKKLILQITGTRTEQGLLAMQTATLSDGLTISFHPAPGGINRETDKFAFVGCGVPAPIALKT